MEAKNQKEFDIFMNEAMRQAGVSSPEELLHLFITKRVKLIKPIIRWQEWRGVIFFTIISRSFDGRNWYDYFERRGHKLGRVEKILLESNIFPSIGGERKSIAIMRRSSFAGSYPTFSAAKLAAEKNKYFSLKPEDACLILDSFSKEELSKMNLGDIMIMHEPRMIERVGRVSFVNDSDPYILFLKEGYDYKYRLSAKYYDPDEKLVLRTSFAYGNKVYK